MKNLFLLLVLFGVSIINGQKYTFDTFTKYSTKNIGGNISYTNSSNDSYCMKISYKEKTISAYLYDYKSKRVHQFAAIETESKDGVFFKFYYQKSYNLSIGESKYPKYAFDFQTLETNDSIKKVKLNIYTNSKKKKILRTYDLEIKDNAKNRFSAFRVSCMHPYEIDWKLNTFEKGIVVSSSGSYPDGKLAKFRLVELVEVNLELEIPR